MARKARKHKSTKLRQSTTPPQLALDLGVGPDKVAHWIGSGELRAVNIATRPDGKPRWLIFQDDVEAFLRGRAARPEAHSA